MQRRIWRGVAALLLPCLLMAALLLVASPVSFVGAQGGVTGFANLRITNFYRAQPRTAITVGNGATVNATGTYQRITAAGAVGASLAIEPAGSIITLVNVGSNTITFTETGNIISAGNIALGANDTATLLSDGTSWYQIAASNN